MFWCVSKVFSLGQDAIPNGVPVQWSIFPFPGFFRYPVFLTHSHVKGLGFVQFCYV